MSSFVKTCEELKAIKIPKGQSVTEYTMSQAQEKKIDAFATINASALERCYNLWKQELPEVQVHYAMKCNPHPAIVKIMRSLGANFDCASPEEVRKALSVGAAKDEIIYANPQKTWKYIQEAYSLDVNTFTFDSELELEKMIENTPEGKRGRFVLRLLPPDESHSVCKFGVKFGANPFEAERIVRRAAELKKQKNNFDLMGISFHVGSGCFSTESFKLAVEYSARVADLAKSLGEPISLLDIGGGYMTTDSMKHYINEDHNEHGEQVSFEETAKVLRETIDSVRGSFHNLKIIAEPGRFFAGDCMTLAIRVFGRRILFDYQNASIEQIAKEPTTEEELMKVRKISEIKYYVGDGMYGWFNSIMFDHVHPYLKYFTKDNKTVQTEKHISHIFGPTCDSMDCILKEVPVPLLNINDYIVAEAFGAYTWAASTEFNGIPLVNVQAVYEEQ